MSYFPNHHPRHLSLAQNGHLQLSKMKHQPLFSMDLDPTMEVERPEINFPVSTITDSTLEEYIFTHPSNVDEAFWKFMSSLLSFSKVMSLKQSINGKFQLFLELIFYAISEENVVRLPLRPSATAQRKLVFAPWSTLTLLIEHLMATRKHPPIAYPLYLRGSEMP